MFAMVSLLVISMVEGSSTMHTYAHKYMILISTKYFTAENLLGRIGLGIGCFRADRDASGEEMQPPLQEYQQPLSLDLHH